VAHEDPTVGSSSRPDTGQESQAPVAVVEAEGSITWFHQGLVRDRPRFQKSNQKPIAFRRLGCHAEYGGNT
jgi:hypothetical protein